MRIGFTGFIRDYSRRKRAALFLLGLGGFVLANRIAVLVEGAGDAAIATVGLVGVVSGLAGLGLMALISLATVQNLLASGSSSA